MNEVSYHSYVRYFIDLLGMEFHGILIELIITVINRRFSRLLRSLLEAFAPRLLGGSEGAK